MKYVYYLLLRRTEKSEMPKTVDSVLVHHGYDQGRFAGDGKTTTRRFRGVKRRICERDRVEMQGKKRYTISITFTSILHFT
jgi:hypothetical protein